MRPTLDSRQTIQVGDLVWIAKPLYCCGETRGLGYTFTVQSIHRQTLARCARCGQGDQLGDYASRENGDWVDLTRLRKYTPPPVTETEKRDEEATA